MKASVPFKNRYLLSTLLVSAVVAVLIHFPEVLSLSDSFEREQLFTGMEPKDVFNEILFTFISLLLLFGFNALIFHFNSPLVRVTMFSVWSKQMNVATKASISRQNAWMRSDAV